MVVASNHSMAQANASKDMSAINLCSDDDTLLRSSLPMLHLSESALQEHDRVSSASTKELLPAGTPNHRSSNVPASSIMLDYRQIGSPSRLAFGINLPRTTLDALSPMERFAILSPGSDPCPWETRRVLNELFPDNAAPQVFEAALYDAAVNAVGKSDKRTTDSSSLVAIDAT